eukprot:TRINITY_DN4639_c0_g1_i1.p1 TRINITY_DN4639_c0_g1~~TRINITY_DN4639_c0_g1_i1.p1  ORF type:complete len:281 (+),score=40.18 TRINITY_DN4639_c0_g1_i1:152-994(+)
MSYGGWWGHSYSEPSENSTSYFCIVPYTLCYTRHTNKMPVSGGPGPSLVKYDNPVLLAEVREVKKKGGATGKGRLPPVDKPSSQTEDILNMILPPREWETGNQIWVQYVGSTPATRMDVINLQEQLDAQLAKRQARETGICPIREDLYSQCFDELIRQVTVSCAERGLLLLRVRDESRMTIKAYKTLYESSIAFGMRKALQAEQGKMDMQAKIRTLERRADELERANAELQAKCEAIHQQELEQRKEAERKHQEDVAFLRKANHQLTSQLQTFLGTQGKK